MGDSTLELMVAINAKLKSTAAVTALVSTRIYNTRVPEAVTFPFISLGFMSGEPFEAQLIDGWRWLVTINIWSRAYGPGEAEAIATAVYEAMHDVSLTLATEVFGYGQMTDRDTQPQGDGITTLIRQRWEFITTD